MKMFRNENVGMHVMKRIYKVIISFVLMCVLVLAAPGSFHNVYAAPLEDCDLDGFDDATGVPVPWPGYDETKGDTQAGPAGSKTPATVPDSNAPGSTNNEASGKTGSESADKSSNVGTGDSKDTSSGKTDSTKNNTSNTNSGKTGNAAVTKTNNTKQDKTGKTESTVSGKSENTKKESAGKTETGKADSAVKDNTGKAESSKTDRKVSDKDDKAEVNKETGVTDSTASGKENSAAVKVESGITDNAAQDSADKAETDLAGSAESDSAEAPVAGVDTPDETSLGQGEESEANTDYVDSADSDILSEELESVINVKGSLEIADVSGSIIHAGSPVLISGSGFAGAIDNLEIVIQSESRQLGIVGSAENGSFEAQFNIPKELKAGIHHIVVLYQGKEITRQEIKIGPKAADSFLQALSVGFTSDNAGLLPGLLILLGLILLGAVAIAVTVLIRPRVKKS